MRTYLGMHLTVDAECKGKEALEDVSTLYEMLRSIPELIGMTPISPPFVVRYLDPPDEMWGWSGVVLIAESHISIHTFPEKKTFSFDCFSCKPFDKEKVISYLEKTLKMIDYNVQELAR